MSVGTRGDRLPAAEVTRRREIVEDLYLRFRSTTATIREAKKLGISKGATLRRLAEIRAAWVKTAAEDAPARAEQARRDIARLREKAEVAEEYAAATQLTRLLAEIDGVRAPEKHEVKVDGPDYSKLPLHRLKLMREIELEAMGLQPSPPEPGHEPRCAKCGAYAPCPVHDD